MDQDIHQLRMRIVALSGPDAPDGPSPDEVIADLLHRYEPEVAVMAAYLASRQVLRVLADKSRTSRGSVLTQILNHPLADALPFDGQAWTALRPLLLARRPKPTPPPSGIATADLLWALGTFQACALIRITGIEHHSDRPGHKTPIRPPTTKRTKRPKKRRR